jgi:hypothetical protein
MTYLHVFHKGQILSQKNISEIEIFIDTTTCWSKVTTSAI